MATLKSTIDKALGCRAGYNLTTGSGNIAIGNLGVAGEANTIRVGTSQTRTFMAGIHGKVISGGSTVLINASGQIGTVVRWCRPRATSRTSWTWGHRVRSCNSYGL